MKFLSSRRGLAALAALLLILFLFRPGVGQLRKRIAGSLGSALGRRVTIDAVSIHLLPRPGFGMDGLVIYDDPTFSDEPMVRAPEVSAAIRLRSLLRGRLEIATLYATEPSINLVRNDQGHWNLAKLLERSAKIPSSATGEKTDAARPAFPYLEASHARINFKLGQAKKSWALTNADVALWQESENSWGARMTAQPIRTDFNLTDTGLVRVNATWERAPNLGETPVRVSLRWENGQLGQVTKLFSGRDRGWRGELSFNASLSGTPKALQVDSQIRIDDFRRYDILGNQKLQILTTCSARYSAVDRGFADLSCESPVKTGSLRVSGELSLKAFPTYDLQLVADKIPLGTALQLVRQAKKDLPADLTASGQLDAKFRAVKMGQDPATVDGKGVATNTRLTWNGEKDQIEFGDIPLSLENNKAKPRTSKPASQDKSVDAMDVHIKLGPFPLAMGAATPAIASATLTTSGYRLSLRGDTEIKNLYRLTNALGVGAFHPTASGHARVDAGITGYWQGFEPPAILGTAQLRNVQTGMRGLNPPIEIVSASIRLEQDFVSVENLSATIEDSHWSGRVKVPRPCVPGTCIFQFDLSADSFSSGEIVEWFTPHPTKRPWYRILGPNESQGKSPLLAVQAHGSFRLARLNWKKVEAKEIASQVDLDRGRITLTNLRGQVFQGSHEGDWVIDASSQPPRYQAKGTLQNIALAEASAATSIAWATGTAEASFNVAASGTTLPDLLAHADGDLHVTMRNGAFTHLGLPEGTGPFPVHTFAADLRAKNGLWKLSAGVLESHNGVYRVSGTISPTNGLNFLFTRGDDLSWNVTGTLVKPKVAHADRTEARTVVRP